VGVLDMQTQDALLTHNKLMT